MYDIGVKRVSLVENASGVIQPVNVSYHESTTIQTHNAVSVGASAWSIETNYHDAVGYSSLSVTLKNDSQTANTGALIYWSNDGVNFHAQEILLTSGISSGGFDASGRSAVTQIKARYFKIGIANFDTVAHTQSAWAYLLA